MASIGRVSLRKVKVGVTSNGASSLPSDGLRVLGLLSILKVKGRGNCKEISIACNGSECGYPVRMCADVKVLVRNTPGFPRHGG